MTTVSRQGAQLSKFVIKELLGLLKTFQRQDIALNMWKIVKKIKMLNCCPKSEKCSISAQKSRDCGVQESWKCKILLQIQKSAEKVPSTIGKCLLLGTNIQNTRGGITQIASQYFEPRVQSRRILEMRYRKNLAKLQGSWVRIKENKPKGKI